jgi:transposase InsO family protein
LGLYTVRRHVEVGGVSVSSPTIQSILIKHEMGSKYDRWLKLEEQASQKAIELTGEQVAFIEKQNPYFRERHVESSRPGELLSQDTFYVGRLKGVGKVYLHGMVDTYGSYAFGFLHTSKQPEAAVLHNDVLPFYKQQGLTVQAILTDNGREFCGKETHPLSFIWRSMTLNIAALKSDDPGPTASSNGSMKPS